MNATDERNALLAAIADSPDDDTVRLVYADWLDEHDQPERAEFIRVQVELYRLENGGLVDFRRYRCDQCCAISDTHQFPRAGQECPHCGSHRTVVFDAASPLRVGLIIRERELLARRGAAWSPPCPRCDGKGEVSIYVCEACLVPEKGRRVRKGTGYVPGCTFSRGFLDTIKVPRLADVLRHFVEIDDEGDAWEPTPWARSLARSYPTLTRVVCRDRVPSDYRGTGDRLCGFWRGLAHGHESDNIPEPIWDILDKSPKVYQHNGNWCDFSSPEIGTDTLAVVVCDLIFGRKK